MDDFILDSEFNVGTEFTKIVLAASSSIIPWETPEALNDSEVGGKNAKLAEMLQGGLPVPPGFAIPAKVFVQNVDKEALTKAALAMQYDEAQRIALNTP